MRSGTKHLRIASVIQIILGIASIALTYFLVGSLTSKDLVVAGITGKEALGILVATYAGAAFQVIAGIFGLLLSKKKSIITVIFCIIIFIPQLLSFIHLDGNILLIIVNVILLLIPYYYLHNAYKNFKDEK